jgi:hypothetical protein
MTLIEMKDRLQPQFDRNLPTVDPDRGWSRLQARLAERSYAEVTERKRRRQPSVLLVGAGIAVILAAFLGVAAFAIFAGETRVASVDSSTSIESTLSSVTSPATSPTSVSQTTTSEISSATTSPAWAARSRAAKESSLQLGEAVISYLNGERDLSSVQSLVTPSAQEDLDLMLSSLSRPTACKVKRTAGSDASNVVQVWLTFTEADGQQFDFSLTMAVEAEGVTITAIERGAVPGP